MTPEYSYPCAFSKWDREELEAMSRVHASGRYTMGAEVEAFESEFAEYHNRKHAIMVNSGSSANLVAVAALFHKAENPLKRGDIAIVPALAWATTYAPLVQYGMGLSLVDCDISWNAAFSGTYREVEKPRLIVTCSVLGNPADLASWDRVAQLPGAYVLNDNCESLGAWVGPLGEKRYTANFGLMSTHSFYHSHQLSAIEGGMVLTDDDELNGLCRMLRDHGMTRWTKPQAFEDEYDFRLMGYNVRPLELHAAIGRAQLAKLDTFVRFRQANWNNWELLCRGLPIEIPPVMRNAVRSPFGLNFTVENAEVRRRLVKALREQSVDCRLPTGGSFRRHAYASAWDNQRTPNADRIHNTGIFLGNAPSDISPLIEKAVRIMRETL